VQRYRNGPVHGGPSDSGRTISVCESRPCCARLVQTRLSAAVVDARWLTERKAPAISTAMGLGAVRALAAVRLVTGVLGLLTLTGAAQQRARTQAVVIHATDTACAALGGLRGDLPPRVARTTVAISAVNTALAVVARVAGEG
jgi:hypothetical protein